jgi:hypothetical protein
MFADGDVGDELTFAPLLLDETHPPVVASDAGDDSGGPVLAAAGDNDQLCDSPVVSSCPRMLARAAAMLASL